MRAVFDTNVLVSALTFEQSTPARAFFTALQSDEVLLSACLFDPLRGSPYSGKLFLVGSLVALMDLKSFEFTSEPHFCKFFLYPPMVMWGTPLSVLRLHNGFKPLKILLPLWVKTALFNASDHICLSAIWLMQHLDI